MQSSSIFPLFNTLDVACLRLGHSSTDGVRAYKRTSTNLKQATLNSGKQEKIETDCKELDSPSLKEPAMMSWSFLHWQKVQFSPEQSLNNSLSLLITIASSFTFF